MPDRKINTKRARKLLKQLDLKRLFIEELNWANPHRGPISIEVGGDEYTLTPIAEQGGLYVYEATCSTSETLPDRSTRLAIHRKLLEHAHEHILIFVNQARTTTQWVWVDREGGRRVGDYHHRFHVDQPGDSLLQKLEGLAFAWEELDEEGQASIVATTTRARAAFRVEKVTKKFYDEFKRQHEGFLSFIRGIEKLDDRRWYASVMLNRLMFLYFIQKKGFLAGDPDYLTNQLDVCKLGGKPFYRDFLMPLFFQGLGMRPEERPAEVASLLGKIPYLNGGLFLPHQVEQQNEGIEIPDQAFEDLFKFFNKYQWHLDDRPVGSDDEINPDVLGYIFEKYINQKEMGAYYTREDITEYITKNTVLPFLFDKLKGCGPACVDAVTPLPIADVEGYIHDALRVGLDRDLPAHVAAGLDDISQRGCWNQAAAAEVALPTETWREHVARRKRVAQIREDFAAGKITGINDFITYNLDIIAFAHDFLAGVSDPHVLHAFYFRCLKQVTILDPTCGSGAFLFAALNLLKPLYEICIERMAEFARAAQATVPASRLAPSQGQWLPDFQAELESLARHPSRAYFIYKSIIVQNLYGVDLMAEAVEICKLRLFLKLAAQVEPDPAKENWGIEPLPDIDFNILCGNTLVGYVGLEDIDRLWATVERGTTERSGSFAFEKDHSRLAELCRQYGHMLRLFRDQQLGLPAPRTVTKTDVRRAADTEVRPELDKDLWRLYRQAGLVPEKMTQEEFRASHQPLHWVLEFPTVMAAGGFDVIVGNPPYVAYSPMKIGYAVLGYRSAPCANLWGFTVERSMAALQRGGRMGMIVQLSLTFSRDFGVVRQMLLDVGGHLRVSSFDNIPDKLFTGEKQSDNTSKQNQQRITLFTLHNEEASNAPVEVSPLVRWRTEERDRLFVQLPHTNARELCSRDSFPKIGSPELSEFIRRWHLAPQRIGDLLRVTGCYSLVVPKTAGYYIAAYPDEMPRTQQMVLHFGSAYDRDLALILLNSNVFYWYWRTYLDGFHVTMGIIEQCPVFQPQDDEFVEIARSLMDAIPQCTVHKGYRGKPVPNVNFNLRMDLLMRADEWILKHVAEDMSLTPLDFIWSKSNSFLSLCVPKSANWPMGSTLRVPVDDADEAG